MALDIPNRMKERLEQDSGINSFTLTSVNNLKPWLDANTTVFFPEYTDHSFIHLNEVLATAESIITDESWDTITPEDISAMIISVLLHDCAMHITEDGFYSLITDTYPSINSQYFSTDPKWSVMWSDYIAEAKRFNSDKLKSIFNDSKPVSDIPDNKIDLTTRDKFLIGEFIRRHHARIAHEIVFNGVPGTDGKTLKLSEEPRRHFLDLCGFIAKSHNMSLRQAVDKIEYKKRRIHLNTHVPFLMSVLRISDYIQVQATRAPSQLLNVKSLISPISKGEWKKHDAILEISHADEDPEALFIDAEPQDALIFEDLRWLFTDIQRELDEIWAVLGEVYGRYDKMANLGINIRRLRSSLDDINEYTRKKKPDFIPKVLKFRTADSEMMELLIAPLYGDKPEIGIRELVRNSVDACLELNDISSKQKNIDIDKPDDFDICVSVIEYENYGEVIIEDYGVGMTLDTIENYFLNIGASFRNSDRWKKTHETDGSSDINRTGRFGIGLLAAYLLGDELNVETRNIKSPKNEGLKFRCSRGSKSVTVSNIDFHVGTRISIKTSKEVISYLISQPKIWDWYCLEKPKLKRLIYKISNKETLVSMPLEQKILVPQCNSSLQKTKWYRVESQEFDDLLWSYNQYELDKNSYRDYYPALVCNGIFVNKISYYASDSQIDFYWDNNQFLNPRKPTIVVYDQNGITPLNIQRNSLTSSTPNFIKNISKDVTVKLVQSFFDSLSSDDFDNFKKITKKVLELKKLNWSEHSFYRYSLLDSFMFSSKGITILDKKIFSDLKPNSYQIIPYSENPLNDNKTINKNFTNFSYVLSNFDSTSKRLHWVRNYFELLDTNSKKTDFGKMFLDYLSGSRIFIRKDDYIDICKPTLLPKRFQKKLKIIWENNNWYLLENHVLGELPRLLDPEDIVKVLERKKLIGTIFHYFDWENQNNDIVAEKPSVGYSIAEAWLELNDGNAYFKI